MKFREVQQNYLSGKWAVVESSDENDHINIKDGKEFETKDEAMDFMSSCYSEEFRPKKPFTVAFVREALSQYNAAEISISRLVEILNNKAGL